MYSLNFHLIKSPSFVESNLNKIKGHLVDGTQVVVERHLNHWEAHLSVTVDGVRLHDSEATPEERTAFDALREAAFVFEDAQRHDRRVLARQASEPLFRPAKPVAKGQ